jgi:hypothetical protein
MATQIHERTREVTLSANRRVGLASEFARAMRLKPRAKLLQVLVRLPGVGYGVVLMPKPKSYGKALGQALGGTGPAGHLDAYMNRLRDDW